MEIKVFGTGCQKCNQLFNLINLCAEELGIEAKIEKVSDMMEIYKAGIMTVPAVMIGGKIVSTGNVPASAQIKEWLKNAKHKKMA